MKLRKKLSIGITLFVLSIIIVYAFFNARLIIAGPEIIIKSPENGSSFDYAFIEIVGTAKNTSFISMNGRSIYVDENNQFSEKLLLPPGTSIIKIDAKDRFGRSTEKNLWYTYTGEIVEADISEINYSEPETNSTSSSSLD
jgi:hypothetical protein